MINRISLLIPALVIACALGSVPTLLQGQNNAATSEEGMTNVQFPNTPIPVILLEYERLTGKRVIRDANIQDKNLSILTSGRMPYAEAAKFIEDSLILNGYALLQTDDVNQMKIVAYNLDKTLTSEGLPVITTADQLPESEKVVTYIMPLSYLTPDEGAELFANIVELHPYGKITALQNASALVITESANVIRNIIELRDNLDVSPQKTIDQVFQLERSDPEEVVEALEDMLGLSQSEATGGAPGSTNRASSLNAQNGSAIPAMIYGQAGYAPPMAPEPRLRAIPRANKILVVATPLDMEHIERLIQHLDAPYENANYLKRKLNYIAVGDFLQIAGDIILRGMGDDAGQTQISGDQSQGIGQNNQNGLNSQNSNNFGGTSDGSTSGGSGELGSAGSDKAAAPQSIVVDKTLLIADNVQNMLIASGPPEHLYLINELLDSMDCRPEQIQISAVISQLNLGDDFEFGFDFIRSLDNLGNGNSPSVGGVFGSSGRGLLDVGSLSDVSNLLDAAQGLTVYGQINNYTDVVFSTLAQTNRFKVLSRPTIYTVNNRMATIETGTRVAIPRNTLTSTDPGIINNNQVINATVDYEDVVLRIDVLPLINANGEITLQIQQTNDDIIGTQNIGGNQVPTIGTQALGTTVMVQDGGTVLLGGLISEEESKSKSGLPLFFTFPMIGRVFGSTTDNIQRQELLIFIQPKIIRNPADQHRVDQDMVDRTRVGTGSVEFSEGQRNNLEVFESDDFNSPEKRISFFNNLFKKKPKKETTPSNPDSVRAVPVSE